MLRWVDDPETGALYVRRSDEIIVESEQVKPGIILDYNEAGNVVGALKTLKILADKLTISVNELHENQVSQGSPRQLGNLDFLRVRSARFQIIYLVVLAEYVLLENCDAPFNTGSY